MKATPRVDRDRCMGTGLCQVTAPKIFEMDAEGHSVPIQTELDNAEDIELVREAVDSCPLEAITLTTHAGG